MFLYLCYQNRLGIPPLDKGCVRDSVDALFFICVLPCNIEAPLSSDPACYFEFFWYIFLHIFMSSTSLLQPCVSCTQNGHFRGLCVCCPEKQELQQMHEFIFLQCFLGAHPLTQPRNTFCLLGMHAALITNITNITNIPWLTSQRNETSANKLFEIHVQAEKVLRKK